MWRWRSSRGWQVLWEGVPELAFAASGSFFALLNSIFITFQALQTMEVSHMSQVRNKT